MIACRRRRILTDPHNRILLREAITELRLQHPFTIAAWVLLPNHLHCIWTLDEGDEEYSKRWGLIKAGFSRRVKPLLRKNQWMTNFKERHHENTIWQRRFWEHQIRADEDFHRHLNYIHYNPVKHGLVAKHIDWPYSTFHRYVKQGLYLSNWGENLTFPTDINYGE